MQKVPCHRVIKSDGSLGGFSGKIGDDHPEIARKKQLLVNEGVRFIDKDCVTVDKACLYLHFSSEDTAAADSWYNPSRTIETMTHDSKIVPKYDIPRDLRQACRQGIFRTQTSGQCMDYAQANLVMLPAKFAQQFRDFVQKNPKPCPLLEVTAVNGFEPEVTAPGADLRKDLPKYRLWENGSQMSEEPFDVTEFVEQKMRNNESIVSFLLGCSFSFEQALIAQGIPVRHIEQNRNVPMYITNRDCEPSGIFSAKLVVSMRPLTKTNAEHARKITEKFPRVHGGPIQIGEPAKLGIYNLNEPDFGDAVDIFVDEIPVFWACAVTPQNAIIQAKDKLPFAITHSPGCMFVTDVKNDELNEAHWGGTTG